MKIKTVVNRKQVCCVIHLLKVMNYQYSSYTCGKEIIVKSNDFAYNGLKMIYLQYFILSFLTNSPISFSLFLINAVNGADLVFFK